MKAHERTYEGAIALKPETRRRSQRRETRRHVPAHNHSSEPLDFHCRVRFFEELGASPFHQHTQAGEEEGTYWETTLNQRLSEMIRRRHRMELEISCTPEED